MPKECARQPPVSRREVRHQRRRVPRPRPAPLPKCKECKWRTAPTDSPGPADRPARGPRAGLQVVRHPRLHRHADPQDAGLEGRLRHGPVPAGPAGRGRPRAARGTLDRRRPRHASDERGPGPRDGRGHPGHRGRGHRHRRGRDARHLLRRRQPEDPGRHPGHRQPPAGRVQRLQDLRAGGRAGGPGLGPGTDPRHRGGPHGHRPAAHRPDARPRTSPTATWSTSASSPARSGR